MKRQSVLCFLFVVSCSTAREQRMVQSAVAAVVDSVDPGKQAVLLAQDSDLAAVQALIPDRKVVALSKFASEHPEEAVPWNILFGSAKATPDGVIVALHLQAVSNPPPGVLYCGTGMEYRAVRVGRTWRIRGKQTVVC